MTATPTEPSSGPQFARPKKWLVLAISLAVIVPCIWHRHIEAGDLGSHVYNAWLAQLIEKGQAPGLYIARQWNNVLFDWLMLHAANLFGFAAAEKIVVSACVLTFFWGVFSFVAAASGNSPWSLAPALAMLAYGYCFNMGFLNFYLSVGLASFCLALLWRGRGLQRLFGPILIPLVWLAHPIGFFWLAGSALYLLLWSKLPRWWKLLVPVAVAALLACVHWYLMHRAQFPVDWEREPFYALNGTDQLALYGPRYTYLAWIVFFLGAACFAVEALSRRREISFSQSLQLPAGLYFVAILATGVLPENLRPSITGGWVGLLASRSTIFTAIFALWLLGSLRLRKAHLIGFSCCAVAFFAFLCQDTLTLNRMEANVEKLVGGLPPGTRVLSTIWAPPDSRISFVGHFVDRACIGHCFSYANYEPSSGQFRIRAKPASPVVASTVDDAEDMQAGEYEVQDEDLPIKEIFQCDESNLTTLCIRDLASGEKNGRIGYHPPRM